MSYNKDLVENKVKIKMYRCKVCNQLKGHMIGKMGYYKYCLCEITNERGIIDLRSNKIIDTR